MLVHDEIIHFCMNKMKSSYDTITALVSSLPEDVFESPAISPCPLARSQEPVELKRLSSDFLRPRTGSSGSGSVAGSSAPLMESSKSRVVNKNATHKQLSCASNLSAEMMDMSSDDECVIVNTEHCSRGGGQHYSMEVDGESVHDKCVENGVNSAQHNGHPASSGVHQQLAQVRAPGGQSPGSLKNSSDPPLSPLENLNLDDLNALKVEITQKTIAVSRMLNMVYAYVNKCNERHTGGHIYLPMFRLVFQLFYV